MRSSEGKGVLAESGSNGTRGSKTGYLTTRDSTAVAVETNKQVRTGDIFSEQKSHRIKIITATASCKACSLPVVGYADAISASICLT